MNKPSMPEKRLRAYAAAHLVLINDGKVLLLRRFNTGYQDGKYSLVTGHLEGNETTKQCIIREAKEEAGITVKPQDLKVVHVMHRLTSDREYFDIYIIAKKWSGDIVNNEPDQCDELKWYSIDGLPSNILADAKFALENIRTNVHYSEFGWVS